MLLPVGANRSVRFIKNAGKVGKMKHVSVLDELERHRK